MSGHLGRSVSIISAAYTPLGSVLKNPEFQDLSERELFASACIEAMKKGGIEPTDIDNFLVGCSGPAYEAKMKNGGPFFADWIGMRNKGPLFHDEGCGSAGFGLGTAVMMVASGAYDCVLSAAVNINSCTPVKPGYPPYIRRMQDNDEMWAGIQTGQDPAYSKAGIGGLSSIEALMNAYCSKYHVSHKEIEDVFVSYLMAKRKEALLNPKAILCTQTYEEEAKQYGFDNVRDYLLSDVFNPLMGSMIRARFLGAVVDGASAVIVCETEKAKQICKHPIEVAGFSMSTVGEKGFCEIPVASDFKMYKEAYAMAGISDPAKEIDFMGIHDCPAVQILPVAEAAGFIPEGQGYKEILDFQVGFDGKYPISTDGGRTQSGHPRSPAFNIEVTEAIEQMRGESGERQIATPPKTSIVYGGGTGYSEALCVLRRL